MNHLAPINNTPQYMHEKKSDLDDRLSKISLDKDKIEAISSAKTRKIIIDKTLGLFRIGEIVSTIINWNDEVNQDIKEAKKLALLTQYLNIVDDNSDSIEKLKLFITNPQGNTLFNKILSILDDSPPDTELIDHLSVALEKMTQSDFEKMFEEHRYALALLSQLTPQALTILSDQKNWTKFKCNGIITNGVMTTDWLNAFSGPYVREKNITGSMIERVQNSINELIQKKYIQAIAVADDFRQVQPTRMGKIILKYIKKD